MRNKYALFPIQHPKLWELYDLAKRSFWIPQEIDFAADLADLKKLDKNELFFVKQILAFFAQSDSIVNENLILRFYKEIELQEARAFYGMQIGIEVIHAETYNLLIDTYVSDTAEREQLYNAIENFPTIAKKAQWAIKWIESADSIAKRLVAFAIVEGIFFSGSFCAIYWLKKRGLMPGLSAANDFIARDEGLHCVFATELFKALNCKISLLDMEAIIKEAVEIECDFISNALPVRLIGMNDQLMQQYIKYTADRVVHNFGFAGFYHVENPFDFMRMIDIEAKGNFFEKRVTEYQKPMNKNINFDMDF